jgi:hypothetical protein
MSSRLILAIQRTFDAHRAFSHDVRVNHGGSWVSVAQQFLNSTDAAIRGEEAPAGSARLARGAGSRGLREQG